MSHTVEILSVGTELLLGNIVNTDAQMLSQGLSQLGLNVFYHTVVGDNPQRVAQAVSTARSRADIIITTGGLGPTCDDLTKNVLAEAFGITSNASAAPSRKICFSRPCFRRTAPYFPMIGEPLPDVHLNLTVSMSSCSPVPPANAPPCFNIVPCHTFRLCQRV